MHRPKSSTGTCIVTHTVYIYNSGLGKSRLFLEKAGPVAKTGFNRFLPAFTNNFGFSTNVAQGGLNRCLLLKLDQMLRKCFFFFYNIKCLHLGRVGKIEGPYYFK